MFKLGRFEALKIKLGSCLECPGLHKVSGFHTEADRSISGQGVYLQVRAGRQVSAGVPAKDLAA